MDIDRYQHLSKRTAEELPDPENVDGEGDYQTTALFLALALNGEAGELGEKMKKYVREDDPSYLAEAYWELGDVLWYMAQMASLLDVDLSEVAEDNLDKLLDRQERDVLLGDGDTR